MVQLWRIRAKVHMDLIPFAEKLKISRSTLTRIEAAERAGRKFPVSLEMMEHIAETLGTFLDSELTIEDLEGVELAPPRPGRPKKKEGEQ